jgi:hypothetical protein
MITKNVILRLSALADAIPAQPDGYPPGEGLAAGGVAKLGINYLKKLPDNTIVFHRRIIFGEANPLSCEVDETSLEFTTEDTPVAQVETATAAGTITQAGTVAVTITSARLATSPITINVAAALNDTAAQWAAKVRAALAADSRINTIFEVGGTSTAISLTSSEFPVPPNDGTLNIALANGTATGVTPAATSANSIAGVPGVTVHPGTAIDTFGNELDWSGAGNVLAIAMRSTGGSVLNVANIFGETIPLMPNGAIYHDFGTTGRARIADGEVAMGDAINGPTIADLWYFIAPE